MSPQMPEPPQTSRSLKRYLLLPLLGAIVVAGCGESTIKTTADKPAAATATVEESPEATPEATVEATPEPTPAPPEVLRVGSSVTLAGNDDGERVKITLMAFADPLPVGEYDQPEGAKHIVGVKLRLTNVGTTVYSDSPSNGAAIVNRNDEQVDATIITDALDNALLDSSLKIRPGSSRVGFIPFEVRNGAKLKMFQLTLSSGFADETGEWRL